MQGRAVMQVHVAADGRPDTPRVMQSSGSELLDRAVIEALRACRAYPRIDQTYEAPYNFTLTD
jgi:TonB family protein